MYDLAIIIPAFKNNFLAETLQSIANQCCKKFTLYIGNDSSPYNLKEIVDQFRSSIEIVYKEFPENFGKENLVAHWERCIDMAEEEKWIWLFSDDDTMDPSCVEDFYKAQELNPEFDLFHFDVRQIDENNKSTGKFFPFPKVLTVEDLLIRRLKGELLSFVVEYIFKKSHFIDLQRFQQFDLAWGSDDATWIKLGKRKGIFTIDESQVYWRKSQFNITPNYSDSSIMIRKYHAQISFSIWVLEQIEKGTIQIEPSIAKTNLEKWYLKNIKLKIRHLTHAQIRSLLIAFSEVVYMKRSVYSKMSFLSFYKYYSPLKEQLKRILFYDSAKAHLLRLLNPS
jgi:glycosyltransferase involved in cell wall biosynthesis